MSPRNDPSEYQNYFSGTIIPSKNPGRGLINIDSGCVEFQTALSFEEEKEQAAIDFVVEKLQELFPNKAKPIPDVPKHLSFDELKSQVSDISRVPIGVNVVTAQYEYFDYTRRVSLLSSSTKEKLKKFIPNYIKMLSLCANNKVIVLNAMNSDELEIMVDDNVKMYNSNFKKVFPILKQNIEKLNLETSEKRFTILVLGYNTLNNHMLELQKSDSSVSTVDDLILSVNNDNFKFILYEEVTYFRKIIDGRLSEIVDNQSGIWIGSDCEDQESFETERIYSDTNLSNDGLMIVDDSVPSFVKFPTIR